MDSNPMLWPKGLIQLIQLAVSVSLGHCGAYGLGASFGDVTFRPTV